MFAAPLEIVIRASVIYVVILIGLRLLGKRHVAQLSIIDLVLILLISNAVQNAMVGNDTSLLGGIIAAATLFILNYLLTLVLYRFRGAEVVVEGDPTLLVHDGRVVRAHLEKEKITEEELERVVREHGIASVREVKNAVMELDGTISVIPRNGEERRIESFKHRKTKYQQRKV